MVWLMAFPLISLDGAGASAIAVVLVGLLFMDLDRLAVPGFLFIAVMLTITVCDLFPRI